MKRRKIATSTGKAAATHAAAKKAASKKTAPMKSAAPSQFATPDGGPWGACFSPRARGEKRCWLVKSEADVFSWDDLQRAPKRTTHWDGVRNFAARNFLRDAMQVGDPVFFYHSMAEPQHIAGICEVVREGYPDHTAFDARHTGFDAESSPDAPTWFMVDLRAVESLVKPVTLAAMKAAPALSRMALLRIGRLSVTPVTPAEWATIVAMSRA